MIFVQSSIGSTPDLEGSGRSSTVETESESLAPLDMAVLAARLGLNLTPFGTMPEEELLKPSAFSHLFGKSFLPADASSLPLASLASQILANQQAASLSLPLLDVNNFSTNLFNFDHLAVPAVKLE